MTLDSLVVGISIRSWWIVPPNTRCVLCLGKSIHPSPVLDVDICPLVGGQLRDGKMLVIAKSRCWQPMFRIHRVTLFVLSLCRTTLIFLEMRLCKLVHMKLLPIVVLLSSDYISPLPSHYLAMLRCVQDTWISWLFRWVDLRCERFVGKLGCMLSSFFCVCCVLLLLCIVQIANVFLQVLKGVQNIPQLWQRGSWPSSRIIIMS
jgi:hypothetical protein